MFTYTELIWYIHVSPFRGSKGKKQNDFFNGFSNQIYILFVCDIPSRFYPVIQDLEIFISKLYTIICLWFQTSL